MWFNSVEFLIFLPVVYLLYRVLSFRQQNWMLLLASYVFYGWWDTRFLFLMMLSTSLDFWSGLIIQNARLRLREFVIPFAFLAASAFTLLGIDLSAVLRAIRGADTGGAILTPLASWVALGIPVALCGLALVYRFLLSLPDERRRRAAVALSIVVQLSILGTFKYFNFFIDSLVTSLNAVGIAAEPTHFNIVLPVGISFYTFQSLSYSIDIYRRELKATDRFFDYALFVAFFPQLVAGPIERARHLLPQFMAPRTITFEGTWRGLYLILLGLFKKIAIADGVAGTVAQAYATPDASWATVVVGTVLFAIQIYCDFSGYSDVARGTSKLLGIDLMVNFRQPYFARSPREFWQRWHISLSSWLSDYLYKPLGGSRGSLAFTCRNLMLTMLLGGLWHGAAWNFVLWGFYHGTVLSLHRVLTARFGPAHDGPVAATLKIAGFGLVTLYGWLLFRATSLEQVVGFTAALFTGRGGLTISAGLPSLSALLGILVLIAVELIDYRRESNRGVYRQIPRFAIGLAIALMSYLIFMGMSNEPAQFIYFQF
jgi:alginate O-acetyltransferase complex protein AlgI